MTEELSPRARAILDAAEQLACGATPAPRQPDRTHAPPPPPAPAPPPPPAPTITPSQLQALAEEVQRIESAVGTRLAELAATVDQLARHVDAARPRVPAAAPSPPSRPAAPVPSRPQASPPAVERDDATRLLAVELAVAGATRSDVDRRLRERFSLRETHLLLDSVFGTGSAPGARLPWGSTPEA